MSDESPRFKPSEMMRRILTIGVGTFFLTEESLRNLLSDFKLPKEMLTGLLESANKTRKEFMQNMTDEMLDRVMDKVNPSDLAREILANNDLEFTVKLRVVPRDSGDTSSSDDSSGNDSAT